MRALGLRHYAQVFAAMKSRIDSDPEHSPDEIWALQHHPVYTQGQAGRVEHVLAPGDIPVVAADRGGPAPVVGMQLVHIARLRHTHLPL